MPDTNTKEMVVIVSDSGNAYGLTQVRVFIHNCYEIGFTYPLSEGDAFWTLHGLVSKQFVSASLTTNGRVFSKTESHQTLQRPAPPALCNQCTSKS